MATILVVDDVATNRQFLMTLLGYEGHRLLEAADGHQALEVVLREHPDLVIADILMPTMDGYEFVRRLRAEPVVAKTSVIFCTAHYHEREAQNLAQACGVSHILVKPCEPEVALQVVDDALGFEEPFVGHIVQEDFSRRHLRLLTDKLSQKVEELTETNLRLNAFSEIILQLASELNRGRLLEQLCHSARDLFGASCASFLEPGNDGKALRYYFTSGMGTPLSPLDLGRGLLGELLTYPRPFRLHTPDLTQRESDPPPSIPSFQSFLGAPVASPSRFHGWLCLQDKAGAEQFSDEEERLAGAFASLAGRICENGAQFSELEHKMSRCAKELEASNKELEAFIYGVSQDLQGPIRGILTIGQSMLEQYAYGLDGEGQRSLQSICTMANRMDQLIGDLLGLSRSQRSDLHRETVNLTVLAKSVIRQLGKNHPDRQVDIHLTQGLLVQGEAYSLQIVLESLLGNAWKFTSTRQRARIELGKTLTNDGWVYFVCDNGVGFDMKNADKLFIPFQRLHSDPEFEGSGIGLATARRMIHRHGGQIWAESHPNHGATFYFTLP